MHDTDSRSYFGNQNTGGVSAAAVDATLSPHAEESDIAASTEAYARRFTGKVGAWILGVQSGLLLTMLLDIEKGSVLDVGGGHAQVTPVLLQEGYRVSAVVSRAEGTERLYSLNVPKDRVEVGNLMKLPYPDRSFDAVVSVRMTAHVQNVEGYIAELCRVSNRSVIIDYTCAQGIGQIGPKFFRFKRFLEGNTRPYAVQTRAEIARVIERNDFVVEEHKGQFSLPILIHRKLRLAPLSRAAEFLLRPLARRYGNPVLLKATRKPGTS